MRYDITSNIAKYEIKTTKYVNKKNEMNQTFLNKVKT